MSPWRKTLWISWIAQFISLTGFMIVLPFLPFYIRELGVEGDEAVRTWAGIISAAGAITLAIFSPIWGHIADKYGRKLMVVRSLFGGAIVLGLMAVVQNVQQLAFCRLLQGVLTGTVAASMALVASVAPSNRSVFALGRLQTAVYAGLCLGPFAGGVIADRFGYRTAFLVASCFLLGAGFLAAFGLKENFERPDRSSETQRGSFFHILTAAGFVVAVAVFTMVRFANMVQAPTFPLFVEELLGESAALKLQVTGRLFSVTAVTAALCSLKVHALSSRLGEKRSLLLFTVATGILAILHGFAMNVTHVFVLAALRGVAMAGMVVHVNALIRGATHGANVGKAFGLAWCLGCVGWVLGSLTGGFLSAHSGLRAPFYVTGACLLAAAVIVALGIKEGPRAADSDGVLPAADR